MKVKFLRAPAKMKTRLPFRGKEANANADKRGLRSGGRINIGTVLVVLLVLTGMRSCSRGMHGTVADVNEDNEGNGVVCPPTLSRA